METQLDTDAMENLGISALATYVAIIKSPAIDLLVQKTFPAFPDQLYYHLVSLTILLTKEELLRPELEAEKNAKLLLDSMLARAKVLLAVKEGK